MSALIIMSAVWGLAGIAIALSNAPLHIRLTGVFSFGMSIALVMILSFGHIQ